jgi:single-stranded DNA-binding protein
VGSSPIISTTTRQVSAHDERGGRLQQRAWTAEDGTAHSVVEVVADELGPSLRWATATTTRATRSQDQ